MPSVEKTAAVSRLDGSFLRVLIESFYAVDTVTMDWKISLDPVQYFGRLPAFAATRPAKGSGTARAAPTSHNDGSHVRAVYLKERSPMTQCSTIFAQLAQCTGSSNPGRWMQRTCFGPMLAVLGLVSACSSSESEQGDGETSCTSQEQDGIAYSQVSHRDGLICAPSGFPFVQIASANAIGDATVHLEQPRAGMLCLSGSASTTELGWGALALGFSNRNADATEVFSAFDADSLGITQLAFSVDSPPSQGLFVEVGSVTTFSCPESPSGCSQVPGFALLTGPGSSTLLNIKAPSRVVAPFAQFQQTNPASETFDPTVLDRVAFRAGAAYDFCVHDFTFLDASGNPVRP